MITLKNDRIIGVWYDLEIGYCTTFESRYGFDEFECISIVDDGETAVLIPSLPCYNVFSSGNLNAIV